MGFDWIPMAQIFSCFVPSIKSQDVKDEYLKPLLGAILNGIFVIDEDDDDENKYYLDQGICAQSRYCILQFLYCEPNYILPRIIKEIIPNLKNDDVCDRLGAVELIWDILYSIDNIKGSNIKNEETVQTCLRYQDYAELNVKQNGKALLMSIIPYLSSLIVPLLRGMTDFNQTIRLRANQIFSISVRLIPLEQGMNDCNNGMPMELKEEKIKNQTILKQLIDPSLIDNFECPFEYNAQLRHYQKDGIKWLWFLRRFHLHGILADDMGLGKTLQSLLIIASSYYYSKDSKVNNSLIICPSTLIYHWQHEINKFIPNLSICPFVIDGNFKKRKKLFAQLSKNKQNEKMIVIMSYNTMK